MRNQTTWPATGRRLPGITYRTRSVLNNLMRGNQIQVTWNEKNRIHVYVLYKARKRRRQKLQAKRIQTSLLVKLVEHGYLRPAALKEPSIGKLDVTPAGREALRRSDPRGFLLEENPLPSVQEALGLREEHP